MPGNNILCHERLAIVGIDSGAQPLTNSDETVLLAVNGEIYNHMALRKLLKGDYQFKTNSDCEVILYLWEELGPELVLHLDGMFSFALYDSRQDVYFVARDPVGITTLYQGYRSSDQSVWFASELKALNEDCDQIISFPPGHYYLSANKDKQHVQYYQPAYYGHPAASIPNADGEQLAQSPEQEATMFTQIRTALEASVRKRLMSDVPFGVLLSGGLDSSLIASIVIRETRLAEAAKAAMVVDEGLSEETVVSPGGYEEMDVVLSPTHPIPEISDGRRGPRPVAPAIVHSFSIGLPGSPDLAAAKRVSAYLGTMHHGFTFTVQEGLDAIDEVIYHLETYDMTTIRASTPMYLLSRKIKAMGVKMVLSGEGSDEIFGGYLYFHSAPSAQALHHECITRIQNLHTSDNLRANKSTMAWGLEARVPFLDKSFLEVAMEAVPANHKLTHRAPYHHRMEKYVLRKAFDTPEAPYLPKDILWRQKEQFSDGVGYSWIDSLKARADAFVSDEAMVMAGQRFPHDPPTTKEGYWYRDAFERLFPQPACLQSVVRWIPRKDWGCPEDPSGRAQKAHDAAYVKVTK